MVHKVLIIGCGNIAGRLDETELNESSPPLTHIKAYKQNRHFLISGCVDPDVIRRTQFQEYWAVENSYATVIDAFQNDAEIDVVSVCSPTESHLEHLEQLLEFSPRLVFSEKPIGNDVDKATDLLRRYSAKNIPLIVNYSRRFDESLAKLKSDFDAGRYGVLRSVSGFYNKGVVNNGSHLLDLLMYLFGDLTIDYIGRPIVDFKASDPTIPLVLSTRGNIQISLCAGSAEDFSLAELSFVFSKAQITMMDGGLNWSHREVAESQLFSGYRVLQAPRFKPGMYLHSLKNAVANVHDVLTGRQAALCTGEDGLKVLKLCAQALSKDSR